LQAGSTAAKLAALEVIVEAVGLARKATERLNWEAGNLGSRQCDVMYAFEQPSRQLHVDRDRDILPGSIVSPNFVFEEWQALTKWARFDTRSGTAIEYQECHFSRVLLASGKSNHCKNPFLNLSIDRNIHGNSREH
jgi:hypothetical protein